MSAQPESVLQVTRLLQRAVLELFASADRDLLVGGRNGPWNDAVTPVRLCCHRLVLLRWYHENIGPDPRVIATADRLFQIAGRWRDSSLGLLMNRRQKGKSATNGLVGQAWVLEGLAAHFALTRSAVSQRDAARIVELTPFDQEKHLWCDPATKGLRPSTTINQQVFFAAMLARHGALLELDAAGSLSQFYHTIPDYLRRSPSGYFAHQVSTGRSAGAKPLLRKVLDRGTEIVTRSRVLDVHGRRRLLPLSRPQLYALLAEGYHAFILFGLALAFPHLSPATRELLRHDVAWLAERTIHGLLQGNPYAANYNNPHWELFVSAALTSGLAPADSLIGKSLLANLQSQFSPEGDPLCFSPVDAATLKARLHELTYLPF